MQTEVNLNYKPSLVPGSLYRRYIKRGLDFFLSLVALVVLSPLLVFVVIIIKLETKGSIFFAQERLGKDMKIFKIYKFRTMVQGAVKYQKIGVEVFEDDARITPFGKYLRRYKIDELPQLINILKGDMAIVGPRPTLPGYIDQYEEWELKRFYVRPGLTGLAQVNGNIYLQRKEKSVYDTKYVEKMNFFNDMKIILKTIAIIIFGEEKFINKTEIKI